MSKAPWQAQRSKRPRQAQRSKRPRQAQRSKRPKQLDQLWDNLLSRQPDLIRASFASLDIPDQKAIIAHLHRMVNETGWQPEQRTSAIVAIQAIVTHSKQE
jgi:hypothetical protein